MKERVKELPHELKESFHKIWLAGMGAFVLAEEEGSKLFKDLVEKGQELDGKAKTTRQKMTGGIDQVKDQLGNVVHKFEDFVNSGIATGLSKVGVPSKDEIELLTKRVEELMKSVDGLKEEEAPAKPAAKKTTRKPAAKAATKEPAKTTTRRTRRTTTKA